MSRSLFELYEELVEKSEVVDLAPVLRPNMPQMSVHPDIAIIHDARSHDKHGYYLQSLVVSEHHGAHVDAPIHAHGSMVDSTVENIGLGHLVGPYKKFDLGRLAPQPGQLITRAELEVEQERSGIDLQAGDIVLVDFGWSKYYRPDEPDWQKRQWWADNNAGLAEDACEYLASCEIKAIGSDTVACDIAVVNGEIVSDHGHRTYFLPNEILIVEGLTRLEQIPAEGIFAALPLAILNGSGSPLRPVAIFERDQ
jgi:kynurenine formamidase